MVICASNPLTKEWTPPKKTKKKFAKLLRRWGKVHQNRKWQGSVREVAFSHTQFNTGIWQMVRRGMTTVSLLIWGGKRIGYSTSMPLLCCVVLCCFWLKWGLQDAVETVASQKHHHLCFKPTYTKEWTPPETSTSHKSTRVQWHHNNKTLSRLHNHLQPSARNLFGEIATG